MHEIKAEVLDFQYRLMSLTNIPLERVIAADDFLLRIGMISIHFDKEHKQSKTFFQKTEQQDPYEFLLMVTWCFPVGEMKLRQASTWHV